MAALVDGVLEHSRKIPLCRAFLSLLGMARVLSIQSHVVSGYVGNKSATFPLQVLGFDVDAINTVHFSNHTGYRKWGGQRLSAEELLAVFGGLKENSLLHYSHILTGYIGSEALLKAIVSVVQQIKEVNPDVVFVCDPVLGDNGKLYVPAELVQIYRDELLPFASIITPNGFEAEQLTGIKIATRADIDSAIAIFHGRGVQAVVLTSVDLGGSDILIEGSFKKRGDTTALRFSIAVPKLPGVFTGTGDLFSALLLAWAHFHPDDFQLATAKAVASIQAVLQKTYEASDGHLDFGHRELRLIQSKDAIEHPDITKVTVTTA